MYNKVHSDGISPTLPDRVITYITKTYIMLSLSPLFGHYNNNAVTIATSSMKELVHIATRK